MQIIDQSTELLGQTPTDPIEMCKFIEMGGRTCYKSEDKITLDSAIGFVQRMLKSGHHSVLEHCNIVFRICEWDGSDSLLINLGEERLAFHQIEEVGDFIYINGNLRAWLDTFKLLLAEDNPQFGTITDIVHLKDTFEHHFEFLTNPDATEQPLDAALPDNGTDLVTDPQEIPIRLRKYMARHITNRAMTHEIVRHRIDSAYSQESQRYVAYSSEIQFIRPVWATDLVPNSIDMGTITKSETAIWLNTIQTLEKVYHSLLKLFGGGPKAAQQAREVLPNSCKTEIVVTRGYDAWKWFFHLRDSSACDPQMQDLSANSVGMFSEISEFACNPK